MPFIFLKHFIMLSDYLKSIFMKCQTLYFRIGVPTIRPWPGVGPQPIQNQAAEKVGKCGMLTHMPPLPPLPVHWARKVGDCCFRTCIHKDHFLRTMLSQVHVGNLTISTLSRGISPAKILHPVFNLCHKCCSILPECIAHYGTHWEFHFLRLPQTQ